MKILVCVKIVPDPEAPTSLFKVDTEAKKVIPAKGSPPVLNPFDENALEAALKIKDSQASTISVMTLGQSIPRPIIRKALATGADELIVLEDAAFDGLDSYATAFILAKAIQQAGAFDLILCGREAADTNAGQVGAGIAELLGLPCITLVKKITPDGNKMKVERVLPDGVEVLEITLPAALTISNELGALRTATVQGLMAAQKKPLKIMNAQQLGVTPAQLKKMELARLFQPVHEGKCEFVTGASPQESGVNLALKLREYKLI
jgi:electron transfer flavoprotein beta subunit